MEKSTPACAATDERFYGLELNPSVVNAAAIPASASTPIALPPPTFLLGRATGSSSSGILSNGRGAFNLPLRPGLDDAMNADLVADFASAMNSALVQNPQLVSDDPMAGFERLYIGKDDTTNDSVKAAVSPPMREQGSPNSAAATLRGPSLLPDSDDAVHDFQSACKDSVVHGGSRGGEADNLADDAWWKRSLAGRKSRGPLSTSTSLMIQKPTRRSSAPGFAETAIYSPFEALASIDLEVVKNSRPKRRNVKISTEPQTVSARHRRMKISDRMRVLQRLVPGGTKMDTASMLDEAISYVKFLKDRLEKFQTVSNAAGGAFGVEHQNLLEVRPGQLYRSSPLGFHPPLPMDCATVVSQGLSSAPQKFETLCTPGYPIDTFRSARSSFADNAYREQFCH